LLCNCAIETILQFGRNTDIRYNNIMDKLKKILLSFVVIAAFVLYMAIEKGWIKDDGDVHVVPPASLQGGNTNTSGSGSSGQTSAGSETINPNASGSSNPPYQSPVVAGQYKDGSYTGTVADAFYGPMQVKAVISGGRITDIVFLQYPSDRATSVEINTQAMPYLKAEAIQIQNANVDIVSGATQSSEGFRVTLASALSQAKK
jgi:uncharacterized protein with FMN-binding domain